MELSVIIVSYNVRVFLENCLTSAVKALQGIPSEIIVVDNASDDGSVEMVQKKFPTVAVIPNKVNKGFGAANNQAAKKANGNILLFLNPDTLVQENTFSVIIGYFSSNSSTGLAGCKILNPDGSLQLACRRSFPTPWVAFTKIIGLSALFPDSSLFSKYNLTYLNPDESYEVDAVSGSCMAIRRSVFEQIAGFDEQFFMYGEDLDLCYRVKQAGWKVNYIHSTQIIHYKGESVRRSDINDVRIFYQAMHLFVQKHFRHGMFAGLFLRGGILVREWIARLQKHSSILGSMALDYLLVVLAWLLAELLRFGEVFHFPPWAYPAFLTIAPLLVIGTVLMFDLYTSRKHSSSRTIGAVTMAFVILAALTFFFNEFAFSRFVIFIAGVLSAAFLTIWRELSYGRENSSMMSKRTLIIGAGAMGVELLSKLRQRNNHGYDIVGFVDTDRHRTGEQISGVEIVGSIDSIERLIMHYRISEVIFSGDTLTNAEILSVIGSSSEKTVNYRLVPSSLEVIIGKTHIDELNDLPLVDIDYAINRLSNRIIKRGMDILIGVVLFFTFYQIARGRASSGNPKSLTNAMLQLPKVLKGTMSVVGPTYHQNISQHKTLRIIGKAGITGLAQVNNFDKLSEEEIAQYNMYYAKNQSFMLDLEILLKTLTLFMNEKE